MRLSDPNMAAASIQQVQPALLQLSLILLLVHCQDLQMQQQLSQSSAVSAGSCDKHGASNGSSDSGSSSTDCC
jgi:hypothetical protein